MKDELIKIKDRLESSRYKSELELRHAISLSLNMLDSVIKNYDKDFKERLKEVILEGWKGKSGLDFTQLNNGDWIVKEYQCKDQFSEPREIIHHIKNEYVENLLVIIKNCGTLKTSLKDLGDNILEFYRLDYKDYKEFNGNRTDYFSLFYYPAKILAHLKIINYTGRTIEVLK